MITIDFVFLALIARPRPYFPLIILKELNTSCKVSKLYAIKTEIYTSE